MATDEPPILACRPWNPEEYDQRSKAVWDLGVKLADREGIPQLAVYPGSASGTCSHCGISVAIGPKQQAVMEEYAVVEVLCTVCVVVLTAEGPAGSSYDVRPLGNDFKRR